MEPLIKNAFKIIDELCENDKIQKFILKPGKNRRLVYLLALNSYDFIEQENKRHLIGISVRCTDGSLSEKTEMIGINIEKHSIETANPKTIISKFEKFVPGPAVIELEIKNNKTKLTNIILINEITKTNDLKEGAA